MDNLIIPPVLGLLGMVMAFVVYMLVMKYPDGENKVKKIGDQIHIGALTFMKTEYKYLFIFMASHCICSWNRWKCSNYWLCCWSCSYGYGKN